MLVFLQFTLTDLRSFTNEAKDMLTRPNWPDPEIDCEFVRNAGAIVERTNLGVNSWVGEGRICTVGKGISIQKNKIGGKISVRNFSKHIFTSRQRVLTKYEFVFSVTGAPKIFNTGLIHAIGDAIFRSEVRLKSGTKFYYHKVSQLAKALKKFHLESTTTFSKHLQGHLEEYILHSSPQMYFYLDRDEHLDVGKKDFKFISNTHYDLLGNWRKVENQTVRIWLHERQTSISLIYENRSARISIMRLHSEFECLRNIFKAIGAKVIAVVPYSDDSHNLQEYFNTAITTFLKEKNEIDLTQGENFLDYFAQIMTKFRPGELAGILNQIKAFNFRRQINEKTLNYITIQEFHMGSKYTFGDNTNAVSIGDNNNLQNITQNIENGVLKETDYPALLQEIKDLQAALLKEDNSSPTMSNVLAATEVAIAEKNNSGIFDSLKKGGVWLFDFAGRVGSTLVAAILKEKLGL